MFSGDDIDRDEDLQKVCRYFMSINRKCCIYLKSIYKEMLGMMWGIVPSKDGEIVHGQAGGATCT